jgi:hypothetical protein
VRFLPVCLRDLTVVLFFKGAFRIKNFARILEQISFSGTSLKILDVFSDGILKISRAFQQHIRNVAATVDLLTEANGLHIESLSRRSKIR